MTALEEIAHLADIRMDVQAELDRITMTIEKILELENGSVIQTNRSAGENIDLVIGGERGVADRVGRDRDHRGGGGSPDHGFQGGGLMEIARQVSAVLLVFALLGA